MSVFDKLDKESEKLNFDMYENKPAVNYIRSPKICFVIFGCSGSNKSTIAQVLKTNWNPQFTVKVCEADLYFYQNGHYNFNAQKLGQAHLFCQDEFKKALDNNTNLVIVSNTSTRRAERDFYINLAKSAGYTTFCLLSENINDSKDLHGVPEETLYKQETNIKQSLKLR